MQEVKPEVKSLSVGCWIEEVSIFQGATWSIVFGFGWFCFVVYFWSGSAISSPK